MIKIEFQKSLDRLAQQKQQLMTIRKAVSVSAPNQGRVQDKQRSVTSKLKRKNDDKLEYEQPNLLDADSVTEIEEQPEVKRVAFNRRRKNPCI